MSCWHQSQFKGSRLQKNQNIGIFENVTELRKVPKSGAFCEFDFEQIMHLKSYVHTLEAKGKSFFTENDVLKETGLSKIALRAALRRLKKKQEIASPHRGFYLIVPPEYQSLQSLPPEQFIDDLMRYLKVPYYVGLMSAAQYYGAAHQKPQTFQVITSKSRKNIQVGRVKVEFTIKSDAEQAAIRQFNTPRGFVRVATRETVVLDLITFPRKAGGIASVFEILSDLSEKLNYKNFSQAIPRLKQASSLQRLGCLFELLGLEKYARLCEKELKKLTYRNKTFLDPGKGLKEGVHNSRWNLVMNTELKEAHGT